MGQIDEIVRHSHGTAKIVPLAERWWVAGVIADNFPLDRESPLPRPIRRVGHWLRLLLLDRPLTNDDRSAVLTLGELSIGGTIAICVLAAAVVPSLPRWLRRSLLVGLLVMALRHDNARRIVLVRRALHRFAPDAVVVSDFVALEPGAGTAWLGEALEVVGRTTPYAVLLPGSADVRRNAARERLYTTRFGLRVAARVDVRGEPLTILVRDRVARDGVSV